MNNTIQTASTAPIAAMNWAGPRSATTRPRRVSGAGADGGASAVERGHHAPPSSTRLITARISSWPTMPSSLPSGDDLDRLVGCQDCVDGLADDHVGPQLRSVERIAGATRTHDPFEGQDVGPGHVADEVADVVVGRCADQFVAGADLHQLAVAHDQDAVAELERLGQVVGDEDHGLAHFVVQPDHLVLHVPPDQRVERRERLVEQQQFRIVGQRAGQPDPLLHAAGELIGVGLLVAGQPDQLGDLARPGVAAPSCDAADLQAVGDVVEDPAVRQQAEVLEDHRHLAPAQVAQLLLAGLG